MPVRAFNTRVLVDQFDFSLDTKGVTVSFAVDVLDANSLQVAAKQSIPGPSDGTIEMSSYFKANAAGTIENELYARLGSTTDCIVCVLLDTTALGNPAYVQRTTWNNQLKIDAPIANVITLDGNWKDTTDRGLSIAHATISATGGQTGVDFGVAGSAGGWATLTVRAIVGTATNATFTIESATDAPFTSPTSHGTFTLSAVGAQAITFAGTVNRYVRLRCTALGGATSFAVTAIVGVAGVTYQLA